MSKRFEQVNRGGQVDVRYNYRKRKVELHVSWKWTHRAQKITEPEPQGADSNAAANSGSKQQQKSSRKNRGMIAYVCKRQEGQQALVPVVAGGLQCSRGCGNHGNCSCALSYTSNSPCVSLPNNSSCGSNETNYQPEFINKLRWCRRTA